MYYKCKYFRIEELVDSLTYKKFGEDSWQFFDIRALKMIDGLREYFDTTIYINNWIWGGVSEYRGLRPKYCEVGALHSAHRFGKAFDMTFKNMTADEVRNRIILDQDNVNLMRINRIEGRVNWIHVDTFNIPNEERIKVVYV